MPDRSEESAVRLAAARAGSSAALGELLESCRGYLLAIARRELDQDLQAKGSASDLVQQTFLEAQQDFARFQGTSEEELLAWLRQLLLNNLVNFTRSFRETSKRQVAQEVRLGQGSSAVPVGAELIAATESPSNVAMRRERAEAVQAALARMPEDYRRILVLRYQEQLAFEEIAQRMGRTPAAARQLWARAIERMEAELGEPP